MTTRHTTPQRIPVVHDDYMTSNLPIPERMAWLLKKHSLTKGGLQRALWGRQRGSRSADFLIATLM